MVGRSNIYNIVFLEVLLSDSVKIESALRAFICFITNLLKNFYSCLARIRLISSQRLKLNRARFCYSRFTFMLWWSQSGSNRRPSACKADALPAELWPLLTDPLDTVSGLLASGGSGWT